MRRPWLSASFALGLALGGFGVVERALADLVGPVCKNGAPPDYPAEGDGRPVVIKVELVLGADGRVENVTVLSRLPEDAPNALDARAIEHAKTLVFEPAYKDGVAIKSKIVYAVRFKPTLASVPSGSVSASASASAKPSASASSSLWAGAKPSASAAKAASAPPSASAAAPVGSAGPVDLKVEGDKLPAPRSASDYRIDEDLLHVAPHATGADMLAAAPGIYVGHVEGDAVASTIFLRGFDAQHGQDIELKVGSVPINVPSHLHGQGYADLGFLIPEVVQRLRVIEGVYDPRQGDFAVAGSAHFELGVRERGYHVKTSLGSFRTKRFVGIWAPRDESDDTFGAVAVRTTDGFGPGNRGGISGSGLAQYGFELPAGYRLLVFASAYGARSGLAGALRRDDYDAGRVGFFDSYPYPTAQAQSAFASRVSLGLEIDKTTETGAHLETTLWVTLTDFRLRANYTGFTQRAVIDPTRVGLGDLVEQGNADTAVGASARFRTSKIQLTKDLVAHVEPGFSLRAATSEQQQNLLMPPDNQTWDRRIDATIRSTDLGAYLDLDLRAFRKLKVAGGVRADVLFYDVDDRLSNSDPSFRRVSYVPGYRRTALGVAAGPRASIEYALLPWLTPVLSYGVGYRSPQARLLAEGERAPYTTVTSYEAGVRFASEGERLVASLAAYRTKLSDDLAFDPGENTLARIGPTSRQGLAAYVVARPWDFLLGSVSVTYVHATLDAPPVATADNPNPAYKEGQRLPFVPTLVARVDLGVRGTLAGHGHERLVGRAGTGFSVIGERPLPHGQVADPFALLDLSFGLRFRELELGMDVSNVLDRRWTDTELHYSSSWPTREIPSTIPARHFVAGAPRTVTFSLAVHL